MTESEAGAPADKQVQGHTDGVVGTYVSGWAMSSKGEPCRITVHDADGTVLGSGIGGRRRSDLAVLFGRADLGFRILVPKLGNQSELYIRANGVELSNSPISVGRELFDGDLVLRRDVAIGWVRARTPEAVLPLVTLHTEDGSVVGSAVAEYEADDSDPHAFRATFRIEIADSMFGIGEFALTAQANGRPFARAFGGLKLVGYLDLLDNSRCAGWLVCEAAPHRQLALQIVRDGTVVGRGRCTVERPDLREHYPIGWSNGFSIALAAAERGTEPGLHVISIRAEGGQAELLGGPHLSGSRFDFLSVTRGLSRLVHRSPSPISLTDPERAVLQELLRRHLADRRHGPHTDVIPALTTGARSMDRPVDVLVPVYKGIEITEACIRSVLAVIRPNDRLILIADCPPEAAMPAMLDRFRVDDAIILLQNDVNQGFVGSVNRGLSYSRDNDVLLLNSDTRLFLGGLEEMRRVLHEADDIGTVTALSNNATIFSYPHPALPMSRLEDIGWDEVAFAARVAGGGRSIDVPTGHGFCMLMRREMLDRVGKLNECFGKGYGEENELCLRATDLGFRHVAAPGAFVEHRESVSFGDDKEALIRENLPKLERMYPEYTAMIMDFEAIDPLRVARWPLDAARLNIARAAGTKFVLIVQHWLGGGSDRAANDISNIVGYGKRTELRLRSTRNGTVELECVNPMLRATFVDADGLDLIRLLDAADVDLVIVHQLLGFGLDMIRALSRWSRSRRSIAYLHDFYPICPRVTLIDAVDRYCGVQPSDVCDRCVALGSGHGASRLNALTATEHRTLFAEMLGGMHTVVAPSADAARHVAQVLPDLPVLVVPHPEAPMAAIPTRSARDPQAIAVLGAIGPHKGAEKLLELAQMALLSHPELRFHVIGYTSLDDKLKKLPNVSITGKYRSGELRALVSASRATVALFLHIWPETYSYTLSEAVEAGLVPVVPDLGAPAERVRATGWGQVYPFPANDRELLDLLKDVGQNTPDEAPLSAGFNTNTSISILRELFNVSDVSAVTVEVHGVGRRVNGADRSRRPAIPRRRVEATAARADEESRKTSYAD